MRCVVSTSGSCDHYSRNVCNVSFTARETPMIPTSNSALYEQYPIVDAFDRIHVWLDRAELPFKISRLRAHCTDLYAKARQPEYQAHRKFYLAIHQPSLECLVRLRDYLGAEVNAELTYVEVARDVLFKRQSRISTLRKTFCGAAVIPYQREPAIDYRGNVYWGRRCKAAERQGNVMTLYTDRPSKLCNAQPTDDASNCFHLEWRATGKDALAKLGIRALNDLIEFDHLRHWDEVLRLYQLPKKTELGRLLANSQGGRANVTSVAYLRRASRWLDENTIKGNFFLHNALKSAPGLSRRLESMNWSQMLDASI